MVHDTGRLDVTGAWPAEGSLAWRLSHYREGGLTARQRPGEGRPLRVLHVLSQQPGKTGSGIYLQAIVKHGAAAGYLQRVVVGIPAEASLPVISPIAESDTFPVRFGTPSLPFPVAGMSDVMPYESARFSQFTPEMLDLYLEAFRDVLTGATQTFRPDVIHTHHLWLVSALTRLLFPDVPIVTTCHGTELRQLHLVPELAPFVTPACSGVDRVMALHHEHRQRIADLYAMDPGAIEVIGAGYREDIFCPPGSSYCPAERKDFLTIVYVGKLSRAKGVPWLIEAMEHVEPPEGRNVRLFLVGAAAGEERDLIRGKAASQGERVALLGAMSQERLAGVLKEADLFVLPSFYEGLPLVVLESLACACRVVVTDLPGMDSWLPEDLDTLGVVERVPLPRLRGPDTPEPEDLPAFTANLAAAISRQLRRCLCESPNWQDDVLGCIEGMNWRGIFEKVNGVYQAVLSTGVRAPVIT
ncbi:MAG TPA: glycosyltransferase [Dissulfurispiraceae bacterium]|nr:glycosyltransferase [Dissulfurispiraceae bacterium]